MCTCLPSILCYHVRSELNLPPGRRAPGRREGGRRDGGPGALPSISTPFAGDSPVGRHVDILEARAFDSRRHGGSTQLFVYLAASPRSSLRLAASPLFLHSLHTCRSGGGAPAVRSQWAWALLDVSMAKHAIWVPAVYFRGSTHLRSPTTTTASRGASFLSSLPNTAPSHSVGAAMVS
eukprot:365721-Chlamydomonas_euryale.AAC.8